MLNINKNFGFPSKNDWILSLDADERISPELAKEIQSSIINHKSSVDGYWIPRKNIIFGKWIEHTGWYPDYQFRLFKKGKGKFEEKHVHEMIKLEGEAGKLESPIIHYNYENISHFLKKTLLYTENEANQLTEKGYNFSWQDSVRFPTKEFVSRFLQEKVTKTAFMALCFLCLWHFIIFLFL